jgi:tRNA-modifying protein YgfZ
MTAWLDFLATEGARVQDGSVASFADPREEVKLTQGGTIVCDLSHLALLRASGEDVVKYLQGQLTNDVERATDRAAQWNGHCTPKGRLLATLLLWRSPEGFWLQTPQAVRELLQKRLQMYILRAKVKLENVSDAYVRIGVAGPNAQALCRAMGMEPPAEVLGVASNDREFLLRLDARRLQWIGAADRAREVWRAVAREARPVGPAAWRLLDIQAGLATILPATQDQFVPQMMNLDLLGGVSFQKGCYTGQEIVARTHYLGKLKRRMVRAHLASEAAPAPGEEIFSDAFPGQPSGMVVDAAPSPDGGYELLLVTQTEAVRGGALRWKSADGNVLRLLTLPYGE